MGWGYKRLASPFSLAHRHGPPAAAPPLVDVALDSRRALGNSQPTAGTRNFPQPTERAQLPQRKAQAFTALRQLIDDPAMDPPSIDAPTVDAQIFGCHAQRAADQWPKAMLAVACAYFPAPTIWACCSICSPASM